MTRIYADYVYGEGPRASCWWTETCAVPAGQTVNADFRCDVAIIGGGFTGLNAALTLAEAGTDVALFEANTLGWGASGRNGGFCCLGGARGDQNDVTAARYGTNAPAIWRNMEKAAVEYVAARIDEYHMDVDRHSNGETWLAHRAKDMQGIEETAATIRSDYGVDAHILQQSELAAYGMRSGFQGGMTIPLGFALNPRKYISGLVRAALTRGACLYENAKVRDLARSDGQWHLSIGTQRVTAKTVLIATNGYSSEHLPPWMAGRYFPAQSSIVSTRPLTDAELEDQGWTSRQMSYDSRKLLHYFRLMPDNRMLFGMRGSLGGTPAAEARARQRTENDFRDMFPHWAHVDLTHFWSGMVCLSRTGFPFVGAVPDAPGVFASLCYHGNGVAMGSYSGSQIARHLLGDTDAVPTFLQKPPASFPFGRFRRIVQPFAYAALKLKDL